MLNAPLTTTVLVVRHAHVENPRDILYGRLPRFRLSQRGRAQAEETARFLAGRPVNVIYTSPLLRARQTAAAISRYHPAVLVRRSALLLETRTSYQGEPNSILKPGFSFYDPVRDPGDESMEDVWERMLKFLRACLSRHPGQTVVAVSHADPVTILRVGLRGKEFTGASLHAEVYPERGSVNQIIIHPDRAPTLTYFDVATEARLAS